MPQMALNLEGIALTPQQGKWRRKAEKVAARVLAPNAAEVDRSGRFPDENIDALREAGLLGAVVDERHGGPGRNTPTAVLVTEALAKGCASTAIAYAMHNAGVPLICALVDDEQAELFVEPLLRGER